MGEYGQPSSPPDLHAEEEPKEHSAQDRNSPEELHAEEVENESQPVHDGSMMRERSDAEQEQSVPSQTTPEEILEEGEAEKEVTQGIIEPARVLGPKKPEQSNEESPQGENQGINRDNGPGRSEQFVVPSKEIEEIKRLWKERQRLPNVIVQLQQQIRILKARKRVKRTSGGKHATTLAKPLKTKDRRTRVHPVVQNPVGKRAVVPNVFEEQSTVQNQKEQHLTVTHVEIQTDDILTCNKEIQTKAQPSGEIRAMNARQRNRKILVNLLVFTTVWDSDPRKVTLREGLTQAQHAAEKLIEQTVP